TLFRKRKSEIDQEMETDDIDYHIERSKKMIKEREIQSKREKIKKFIPPILIDLKNYFQKRK
ncbi:MAG: hypothetical protein ACKO7D_06800, partial [Bacteroidota bacterium]